METLSGRSDHNLTMMIAEIRSRLERDTTLYQAKAQRAHVSSETAREASTGKTGCSYCKSQDHDTSNCSHPNSHAARARKRARKEFRRDRKDSRFPNGYMRDGDAQPRRRNGPGSTAFEKIQLFCDLPRNSDSRNVFMKPPKFKKGSFRNKSNYGKCERCRKQANRAAKTHEQARAAMEAAEAERQQIEQGMHDLSKDEDIVRKATLEPSPSTSDSNSSSDSDSSGSDFD